MDGGASDAAEPPTAALAQLSDGSTAPEVPPEVSDQVVAALRAAPPPAHHVTGFTGPSHRARPRIARLGLVTGIAATLVAVGLGTAMLLRTPESTPSTGPTADRITVPPPSFPLSGPQIADLLHRPPDFGALADPQRRASCLTGLGYPASAPILGAQPVQMAGTPAVLLVLAGGPPSEVAALVVRANCSSADTGLMADTSVPRS